MYRPSSSSQNVAAPAFGTLVAVHPDANLRLVYGTVQVQATVGVGAWVQAQVETGPGTDTYDTVFEALNGLGLLQSTSRPFCFAVEGGRRYRFVKGGGLGVTETVLHYSAVDI